MQVQEEQETEGEEEEVKKVKREMRAERTETKRLRVWNSICTKRHASIFLASIYIHTSLHSHFLSLSFSPAIPLTSLLLTHILYQHIFIYTYIKGGREKERERR